MFTCMFQLVLCQEFLTLFRVGYVTPSILTHSFSKYIQVIIFTVRALIWLQFNLITNHRSFLLVHKLLQTVLSSSSIIKMQKLFIIAFFKHEKFLYGQYIEKILMLSFGHKLVLVTCTSTLITKDVHYTRLAQTINDVGFHWSHVEREKLRRACARALRSVHFSCINVISRLFFFQAVL